MGIAALVVGLGAAGGARADEDDPFAHGRADLGFGILAGSTSVGPVDGPAVGVPFVLGWNRGQLYVYGEYDLLSIGQPQEADKPIRGLLHRLSASARYAFAQFGGGDLPVEGEFWLEGGIGRELVSWDGGGQLHRNDVGLGVGAELNILTKRDRPRPQVIGLFYAFRLTLAHAPGVAEVRAMCGGPCDEATPPSPYDLGLFFNGGLSWGR